MVYVGASCSLLIIDRGNQAIREIQLNDDDCSSKYDGSFNLGNKERLRTFICPFSFKTVEIYIFLSFFNIAGMAVLVAAGFFGYMLALLQRRVRAMFSSKDVSYPRYVFISL